MIKGFLKNAGNVLKDVDEIKVKSLRSKIDNYLFVTPRRVYLGKTEPEGYFERPLRAMTQKGPRVTLARSDQVNEGLLISFEISLIPHKELSWTLIDELFEYGKLMGLGQFRNGGFGRFEVVSAT
jgi:hypothetical protein